MCDTTKLLVALKEKGELITIFTQSIDTAEKTNDEKKKAIHFYIQHFTPEAFGMV